MTNTVTLLKDIDWTDPQAQSTALIVLCSVFSDDPLISLFDEKHQRRLAGYVVMELAKLRMADDEPASMYFAGSMVTHTIMPRSLYSVFGTPLASQVGYLVQAHLYPNAYKEAS